MFYTLSLLDWINQANNKQEIIKYIGFNKLRDLLISLNSCDSMLNLIDVANELLITAEEYSSAPEHPDYFRDMVKSLIENTVDLLKIILNLDSKEQVKKALYERSRYKILLPQYLPNEIFHITSDQTHLLTRKKLIESRMRQRLKQVTLGQLKLYNFSSAAYRDEYEKRDAITYLNESQRFQYQVFLSRGQLVKVTKIGEGKNQKLHISAYDTTLEKADENEIGKNKAIMVVDPNGRFYSGSKVRRMFQHSSFLSGSAVLFAGCWRVKSGILLEIMNASGHYKTTLNQVLYLLSLLERRGIDISQVKITYANNMHFSSFESCGVAEFKKIMHLHKEKIALDGCILLPTANANTSKISGIQKIAGSSHLAKLSFNELVVRNTEFYLGGGVDPTQYANLFFSQLLSCIQTTFLKVADIPQTGNVATDQQLVKRSWLSFFNPANGDVKFKRLGGWSNFNYLVQYSTDQKFVLRLSRRGPYLTKTVTHRNYHGEYLNLMKMKSLGIAPRVLFHNQINGIFLFKYIEGMTLDSSDFLNADIIKKAAIYLKNLHTLDIRFDNNVSIVNDIEQLRGLLINECEDLKAAEYDRVVLQYQRIKKILDQLVVPKAPCHCDVNPNNFILTKSQLVMVDWEYSGNDDPARDLALLIIHARLDNAREKLLLSSYESSDDTLSQRVVLYKGLVLLLSLFWLRFQIKFGDDLVDKQQFYNISMMIYENCKDLILSPLYESILDSLTNASLEFEQSAFTKS